MQESRSKESNEKNANRADKTFQSYNLNGDVKTCTICMKTIAYVQGTILQYICSIFICM